MFASPLGKLLVFALVALAVLIALSALWAFFLAAPYDHALVAAADHLSGAKVVLGDYYSEQVQQDLGLKKENIYIAEPPAGDVIHGFLETWALDFGLLLVVSLIVATPGLTWCRRLYIVPVAVVIMFVLQLVTVLIFAQVSLSGADPSRNPFVTLFISLGTGLFPALVWGALSLKYWFPRPQKAARPGKGLRQRH